MMLYRFSRTFCKGGEEKKGKNCWNRLKYFKLRNLIKFRLNCFLFFSVIHNSIVPTSITSQPSSQQMSLKQKSWRHGIGIGNRSEKQNAKSNGKFPSKHTRVEVKWSVQSYSKVDSNIVPSPRRALVVRWVRSFCFLLIVSVLREHDWLDWFDGI
jgi:hypothetical protein